MRTPGGRAILGTIGAIACLLVVALALAPPAAADDHTGPPPVAETFEANDDVHVWERSFLPLRADATDAAATVPNADWRVRSPAGDEASLGRDPIPVFDPGTEVGFTFDEGRANKGGVFQDTDVHVVRARIEGTEGVDATTGLPEDFGTLLSDANDNATFTSIARTTFDDGRLTFEDEPTAPGNYVYVAVTEADGGLTVSGGDLSIDGQVTVVGAEHALVRTGTSAVDAPNNVPAGETATFEVEADGHSGSEVTRAVALYHEKTYVNQYVLAAATDDIDDEFDLETDTQLESSLAGVNGVAEVADDVDRLGVDVDDRRIARSAGVGSILDILADRADTDLPGVRTTGSAQLDGSVTITDGSPGDTRVDVDTFENWTQGNYRWITLAVGENSRDVSVRTGTFPVRPAQSGGGDDDDDHRDDDDDHRDDADDDDGDDEAGAGGDCAPQYKPANVTDGDQVRVSVECVRESTVLVFDLGLPASNETDDVSFEQLNVTAGEDSQNVTATMAARSGPPADVPGGPLGERTLAYFTVELRNFTVANATAGTLTFNVSTSRLEELDVDPGEIRLARLHNGTWQSLNTTHRGDGRFRAETPGFSTFAVGAPGPALSVNEAAVDPAEVAPGETVSVSATVDNAGRRNGSTTLSVTANGTERAVANVSVPAGGNLTERVDLTFEEAGTYDLAVDGVAAGTVTVSSQAERGLGTATPSGDEDDGAGGGLSTPLIAVVVVVVLLVLGGAIYFRDL